MEIRRPEPCTLKGQRYAAEVRSDRYLSIEPDENGFRLAWVKEEKETVRTIGDEILSDWLEDPVLYGAYEGETLVGFAEGFTEKWNGRFRITNICVFDENKRHCGIGQALLDAIMAEAEKSGVRMAVLETQSFNEKAISFYRKNGFEIIGFDRYAYGNDGPETHNMRIEMGKKLQNGRGKINITSGQMLNELLSQRYPGERFIPFNEAMIKGTYTAEPFSGAFIRERALCHGVTEEEYRDTMKDILTYLEDVNAAEHIVTWFGGEDFCLANKRVLFMTLKNKGFAGHLTCNTVDETTGKILNTELMEQL